MSPPLIRVEDHSTTKVITTYYQQENNEIDFQATYKLIKSLLIHPPCLHRCNEDKWPCSPCETRFTEKYWTSAASLLDYFADFFATDTPFTQSLWWHLFDIWQETATYLPVEAVLDAAECTPQQPVWGADRAKAFQTSFDETLDLFGRIVLDRCSETKGSIIYPPDGEAQCPVGREYETGPWISGLKPWQQFLYEGSPGVAAPPPIDNDDNDDDGGRERKRIRHIPMSAIAIIKQHTEYTRSLAHAHFSQQDAASVTENLNTFDQYSLHFPSFYGDSHTYASSLTGLTTSYTLVNGAPPIMRYSGYGDPSMQAQDPDWNLLDECVGICRGVSAYEPRSGHSVDEDGEDGEEQEGDDGDDEMREGVFDMWTVVEHLNTDDGGAEKKSELADGFGDMFDYWCEADEL
jgi:hypothetical protein